jgi:hypothetical protein
MNKMPTCLATSNKFSTIRREIISKPRFDEADYLKRIIVPPLYLIYDELSSS